MSSRDNILDAVAKNQPLISALPVIDFYETSEADISETFINTLTSIGGNVVRIKNIEDIQHYITANFKKQSRVVTTIPALKDTVELISSVSVTPHSFYDLELAIIEACFGVAENGAIWVTEERLIYRALPFICQHLAILLPANNLVTNMHYAYEKIGADNYGFGTFIAGPSKTADIEQSLVLGAHGSRSMTIFLLA